MRTNGMKSHLDCAGSLAALCSVFLLGTLTAGTAGSPYQFEARIALAMQGSQRFVSSHSLDDLQSSIDSLTGAVATSPSAMENVAARRSIVRAFALIFKQIDASVDPTYDPSNLKDIPSMCLVPPREGPVQLPSCADPADIKDPQVRATYIAALKENDAKIQRRTFQAGLPYLDSLATSGLYQNLFNFRAVHTPDDSVYLGDILQSAGLSPERCAKIKDLFAAASRLSH